MASIEKRLQALEAQRGPRKIVVLWECDGKRYTDSALTVEAPPIDDDDTTLVIFVVYRDMEPEDLYNAKSDD